MGACTFTHTARIANSEEAFSTARREAAVDYGVSYSGTIASKDSFVVVERRPLALEEAEQLACHILDNSTHPSYSAVSDKWGPAGAIALNLGKPEVAVHTLHVETTEPGRIDARTLAEAELALSAEQYLLSAQILEDHAEQNSCVSNNPGKATTRYHVVRPGSLAPAQGFQDSYDSVFDAKVAITRKLKEPLAAWENAGDRSYEVVGIVRREDGSALAQGHQQVLGRKITIQAEVGKLAPRSQADGWLFFGWASC